MKLKTLTLFLCGLLVIGTLATLPILSTTSHSSLKLQRSSQTNVVNNDSGVLAIQQHSQNITEDESEQALVSTKNQLNTDQNVTVKLSNDVSKWTLSNGDQANSKLLTSSENSTFYLTVSEVEQKKSATFYVNSTTGNFWFSQKRTILVKPAVRPLISGNSTNNLQIITPYSVTTLTTTGEVISPANTSFDADEAKEFAYTQGNGNIYIIDKYGEQTASIKSINARNSPSRYWAGSWSQYGTGIYYTNESDQDIYYTTPSGSTTHIVTTKAKPVVGKGDIDNDTVQELVFAGGSMGIKYLEPDDGDTGSQPQVHKVGVGTGSNYGVGLGHPADFNEDGDARIPYVDGSNALQLTTETGTKTKIATGVEKTSIAPLDWDKDGTAEILFVDKSSHALKMADLENGTWSITTITHNGNKIIISKYTGVA